MRSIRPNSEIELNLDRCPMKNHLRLYGNEQLLSISFNNLIDNACKFSENKKWVIKLFSDNQFVNVDIIDRGIGIHSQDLSKIFSTLLQRSKHSIYSWIWYRSGTYEKKS